MPSGLKLLEALMLLGKDLPDKGLEVLKHPKYKDLLDVAKGDPDKVVRVMKDPEGNNYAWGTHDATHQPVAEALGYSIGDKEPHDFGFSTDVLGLDKGKLKSLQYGSYDNEELHSDIVKKYLSSLGLGAATGAEALTDDGSQSYASGGLVVKSLQKLLESLQEAHPERLARAKKQGFDTSNIYLHGTNSDIKAFEPDSYFTSDPDYANHYAANPSYMNHPDAQPKKIGNNVVPVFLKKGKVFDETKSKKDLKLLNQWIDDTESGENAEDLPTYLLGNYPELNYGSIYSKEFNPEYGKKSSSIQIFNPSDVRSIFANFDPKKIDSEDLLAGLSTLGIGSKLAPTDENDQSYAKGGLVNKAKTVASGLLHGATFGNKDEIEGAIGSTYAKLLRPELFKDEDIHDLYREARDKVREEDAATEEADPLLYAGSSLAGMLPWGAAATLPKIIAQSVGMGALEGYGNSTAEDLKTQAKDAGISSAEWAALPVGWKLKKLLAPALTSLAPYEAQ